MADTYNAGDLSPMMQRFVKGGKALIVAFAAPVRAAFDIIQNSVVTAALTWSLFFCALVGVLEYRYGDDIRGLYLSATEANNELARQRKIANEKSDPDGSLTLGEVGPFTANYQAEVTAPTPVEAGIVIEFFPAKNATAYYLVWKVSDKQGMWRLDTWTPDAEGKVRWFIPGSKFGTNFATGRLFTLNLQATNGVTTRYASSSGSVRIQ